MEGWPSSGPSDWPSALSSLCFSGGECGESTPCRPRPSAPACTCPRPVEDASPCCFSILSSVHHSPPSCVAHSSPIPISPDCAPSLLSCPFHLHRAVKRCPARPSRYRQRTPTPRRGDVSRLVSRFRVKSEAYIAHPSPVLAPLHCSQTHAASSALSSSLTVVHIHTSRPWSARKRPLTPAPVPSPPARLSLCAPPSCPTATPPRSRAPPPPTDGVPPSRARFKTSSSAARAACRLRAPPRRTPAP